MLSAISNPTSLSTYIKEIKQFKSLTAEEEYNCFVKYHNNKCLDSMYKIITSNLRFVVHVARQYSGYNVPLLELIQEGNIGLMTAAKLFDLSEGVRFISYAVWHIKSAILKYVKQTSGICRFITTKSKSKLFFNKDIVYDSNGDANDVDYICNELNVPKRDVLDYLQFNSKPVSLHDDEGLNVDVEDSNNLLEHLIEHEHQEYVMSEISRALSVLDDRERIIINSRFLTDNKQTFEILSKQLNISKERIRQLETQALNKIRYQIRDIVFPEKYNV